MQGSAGETDLSRYSRRMKGQNARHETEGGRPSCALPNRAGTLSGFPFGSVAVLIVLMTLFLMSMERGGWSWSSWTYAFSFTIGIPLVLLELKRKVVITGGALILLFFMVLIDAGMPGYLGYSPSDLNWYDNLAHLLGTAALTLFLWSFLWWALSPTGPPAENGARKLVLVMATMFVVSFLFEFTEFFTDAIFGWSNFHPGIDTAGDLIFDSAGIICSVIVIARHRVCAIRKPYWNREHLSAAA